MPDFVNSIPFLYAAYTVVIVAQLGYVAWLGVRWSRTKR